MKNKFLYGMILFCITSVGLVSCEKENELNIPVAHFISIENLRNTYQGEPTTVNSRDAGREIFIGGIVISNSGHGNIPDNKIVLQNYENNVLRGITLSVEGNVNRYQAGDSVVVRVEGHDLERVDGILQVSNLEVRDVGIISSGNEERLHTETDNFNDVQSNMDIYESTLVKLLSVDVLDVERGTTFGDGDLELSDGGSIIFVKTLQTASFAIAEVPVSGNFTGVLFYSNEQSPYLMPRSSADYSGQFLAPENYIGFPEGWEDVIGTRKTGINSDGYDEYLSGRWFFNNGFTSSSGGLIHKNETWALMMSNVNAATVSMDFDLEYGASKFSFYYGAATANPNDSAPITLYVEYSQDSGDTWLPIDPDQPNLIVDDQSMQHFKEYDIDIEGTVRFRIRKEAGSGRLIVDDIFIKPDVN